MKKPADVDEYIAAQPAGTAQKLKQIRQTIRDTAPLAQEKISYSMPYYSLNGRLVYFMAHTQHIGFYPMSSAIKKFEKDLTGYHTSKGTIQFPLDKPLPLSLIKKIVEFRAKENLSKKN